MRKLLVISILLASHITAANALNILPTIANLDKKAMITLTGPINPADDLRFREIVTPLVKQGYLINQVYVYSRGGDVAAAMSIGDQIRVLQASTTTALTSNPYNVAGSGATCVFPQANNGRWVDAKTVQITDCTCESACFLIWLGGSERFGTRIGVHRFYWRGPQFGQLSPSAARQKYQNSEIVYRQYLAKMNVPAGIVDKLFAAGSQEMYFLTYDEIQLLERVPYLEEMQVSRCGTIDQNTIGITSQGVEFKPGYIECLQSIDNELYAEGARDYLVQYHD